MTDPLSRFALLGDAGREGVKRRLSDYSGTLLFLLCLLITALMPLVLLRPVNPISRDFLSRTLYSLLTGTLTYLVFLPEGRRSEGERSPRYAALEARHAALSAPILRVGGGLLSPFRDFCAREEERLTEEGRRRRLSRAGLDPDTDPSTLSKKERRRFCRLSRSRGVLLPFEAILSEAGTSPEAPLPPGTLPLGVRAGLKRPVLTLLSSLLLASFEVLPSSLSGKEALVKILLSATSVLLAAFSGFSAGAADRRERALLTERRILLLTAFYEAEGYTLPETEKSA